MNHTQNLLGGTAATLVFIAGLLPERPLSAADWPQWRGPDRSNVSSETGLLQKWPPAGPPLLWRLTGLGDGIASVSVVSGHLYTLGYKDDGEYVFALDARTGDPRWASWIGPLAVRESPLMRWLSQRSPTIADDKLYVVTRTGELHCLSLADGRPLWSRSYAVGFGAKMPMFGFGDHPLVDGPKLICTPGGPEGSIVAFDKNSGELLWKTVVPGGGAGAYAAVIATKAGGIHQYVTFLEHALFGVDAEEGRLLWRYSGVSQRINQITPIVDGDQIFCGNGFRANAIALLRLVPAEGGLKVEERYLRSAPMQYLQDAVVRVGDYVYSWKNTPLCIELNSGALLWGNERGMATGRAAVLAADGHLYFRTSDGLVSLVEASSEGYREKGNFRIPDAVTALGATSPVIADGQLYVRDNDRLFCYDIRGSALDEPKRSPKEISLQLAALPTQRPTQPGRSSPAAIGSQAIFVPTPPNVVEEMLRLAGVTNRDLVIDLGSGDGRILVTAAAQFGARALGYELDPRLVEMSREHARQRGLNDLVQVKQQDLFEADLSDVDIVALYLPEPVLERLLPQLRKLKPGARIVSHQFEIPGVPPQRRLSVRSAEDGESHQIFLWIAPLGRQEGK